MIEIIDNYRSKMRTKIKLSIKQNIDNDFDFIDLDFENLTMSKEYKYDYWLDVLDDTINGTKPTDSADFYWMAYRTKAILNDESSKFKFEHDNFKELREVFEEVDPQEVERLISLGDTKQMILDKLVSKSNKQNIRKVKELFIKEQINTSTSNKNIMEEKKESTSSKLQDKDDKLKLLKDELDKAKLIKDIQLIKDIKRKIKNRQCTLRQYRKSKTLDNWLTKKRKNAIKAVNYDMTMKGDEFDSNRFDTYWDLKP